MVIGATAALLLQRLFLQAVFGRNLNMGRPAELYDERTTRLRI